ncbi:MAG: alpha-N-acetylglucosaminidase [Prevotella sp.]|nr:alpha-N-acetylglucosaminidase [Prevotella sp.]
MRKILFTLLWLVCLTMTGNPVDRLINRISPGAASKFKIVMQSSDRDFFELSQAGDRVCIKGNTWVNIASGLNWYLKYYAGIHLTWNNMTAKMPATLPKVPKPERHETDLKQRYDFNYCTFSYSMAFWDWKRWEQEIDWMALHGVNMPLAIVGEEVVWRNMLQRLGYSKDEIGRFIAGPAFLAWWEMNNLEGWGGPLPDSWYTQQEALQKRILSREKELGMDPVLPGYCGMMPHDAKEKLGLDVTPGGTWNGYIRPANLSATDPKFDRIADLYYQELTRLYGKANYYSMDPFHETPDDASIDYAKAGQKLLAAMKRTNPKANWVIQGWTENPRPQMIDPLPEGDITVLDLFSECRPMFGAPSIWKRTEGYGHHNWLFCMLENFGANVGLHGRMDQLVENFRLATAPDTPYQNARQHLKGIGFTMEGSENNPIMFELMSELVWRADSLGQDNTPATDFKTTWTRGYVKARYGADDPTLQQAWQLLVHSIYNCPAGNNQQGPHESIFDGRPSLINFQAKSWSKMRNYYDPSATLEAARLMTSVAERYRGNNNFEYDLVDVVRQAMDDQARLQYLHTIADYNGFDRKAFSRDSARFLNMLLLQDKLLGTRREFRLGTRIEQARSLGTTAAEKDLYEWNARVQITTWGNRTAADTGGLRDYAHKEWQGLLKDFYFMRWHTYLDALSRQMAQHSRPDRDALGGGPNATKTASELFNMALPSGPQIDWYALEEPWTLQHNTYSSAPEGSPVDVAKEVIAFLDGRQN